MAVIRLTLAPTTSGTSVDLFEGGRIKITNEPVKLLIRMAFQLQNAQIAGGPGWMDNDRYDIEAKTGLPGKLKPDQISVLMQNLLADRFHLQYHRETREAAGYALIAASGGPKLKPKAEGETAGMNTRTGPGVTRATATATSLDMFASYVGNRLGRIVVDRTGLSGAYDFTLEWAPDPASDSAAPSLTTALREQLGLRLESQKVPMQVLVIDRLDRPTEN